VGANVVINGRDARRVEETRAILAAATGADTRLSAVVADISTEGGATQLRDEVLARWGRVDALINNAGISMRGPIAELRKETLEQLVSGNLMTAILPTIALLPHLRVRSGSVLFVSTVASIVGFPGVSAYSAAKAAVERMAEALEGEERTHGVSSGVVLLGFVENDPDKQTLASDGTMFHHTRRAMQTQEAAAAAILRALARRKARTITVGQGRALDLAVRVAPRLTRRLLARTKGSIHSVDRA
jgi:short-subunit dehydrogenase